MAFGWGRGGGGLSFGSDTRNVRLREILFPIGAVRPGVLYMPWMPDSNYTDTAMTTLATVGQSVAAIRDYSGNSYHATQSTSGSRPTLGRHPPRGIVNILRQSDTLATQSRTVTAEQHTLSFVGTGTVTLTGVSTAGPLVGTGAEDVVSLVFTPTAGSLTLTVSGTVSVAQLELGGERTTYQAVADAAGLDVTEAGQSEHKWYLYSDGVDDVLETAAIPSLISNDDGQTVALAAHRIGTRPLISAQYDFAGNKRVFGTRIDDTGTASNYRYSVQEPTSFSIGRQAIVDSPTTRHVFMGRWEGAAGLSYARIDDDDWVSGSVTTPSVSSVTQKLEFIAAASQRFNGRCYGYTVSANKLTASERDFVRGEFSYRKGHEPEVFF